MEAGKERTKGGSANQATKTFANVYCDMDAIETKLEKDEFTKASHFISDEQDMMVGEKNINLCRVESKEEIEARSEEKSTDGDSSVDKNGSKTNNDGETKKVSNVLNIDENSVQMESDVGGNNDAKNDQNDQAVGESDKTRKRKRKHTRRGSKKNKPRKPRHKFKPYNTLTWDEKRKLGEHDAVRAMQRRKELMLQKGCPIAPYNTTQFLMEEHAVLENLEAKVILNPGLKPSDNNNSDNARHDNDDTSSSSVSDDEYFDKDFNEFYERVHIDTLNSYSKEDLISYIYELERKIENLEKFVRTNQGLADQNARLSEEVQELKGKVGRAI